MYGDIKLYLVCIRNYCLIVYKLKLLNSVRLVL